MPLNIVPLTPAEKSFIAENSATLCPSHIAKSLGRSEQGVSRYIRKNKLPTISLRRRWTKEEVAQLLDLSETYGVQEIASKTGLSKNRVAHKLRVLGARTRSDVFSLKSAAAYTGYHPRQLLRARAGLQQTWILTEYTDKPGCKPMKRYRISHDQLEELCAYLKYEGSRAPSSQSPKTFSKISNTTSNKTVTSVTLGG